MPPPSVDDHTEDFDQLAGLAALGALDGDEQVRFEAHSAHCERCRLMVRLDLEALARTAPEMDPSPGFKARLMQRAAAELAADEASSNVTPITPSNVTPIPAPAQPADDHQPVAREPAKVLPFWRRSPWTSLIAAVLVIGIVTAGAFSYQNQVIASYALSGNLGGSAVVNVRRSGATELNMNGVQNPRPGYIYEAWIIPPNSEPVAAGTMSSGDAAVPLTRLRPGTTVAVTQERGRVDAPTGEPLMAVVVQS